MDEILITLGSQDRDPHVITPEELFCSSDIITAQIAAYQRLKRVIFNSGTITGESVQPDLFDKLNTPFEKLLGLWQSKSLLVLGSQHIPQYKWEKIPSGFLLENPSDNLGSEIRFMPKDHNDVADCDSVSLSISNRSYPPGGICSFGADLFDSSVGLLTGSMNLINENGWARCTFYTSRVVGNHVHTLKIEFEKEIQHGMHVLTVIGTEEYESSEIGGFSPQITSNFKILGIKKPIETSLSIKKH
jgi:hypothetical protein